MQKAIPARNPMACNLPFSQNQKSLCFSVDFPFVLVFWGFEFEEERRSGFYQINTYRFQNKDFDSDAYAVYNYRHFQVVELAEIPLWKITIVIWYRETLLGTVGKLASPKLRQGFFWVTKSEWNCVRRLVTCTCFSFSTRFISPFPSRL